MSAVACSTEERRTLLDLARAAIASRLAGRPWQPVAGQGRLRERAGVFVTLRRRSDGGLRGCVGLVEGRMPLAAGTAYAAQAAAFDDGRFDPLAQGELEGLEIDISILSPMTPIAPDAVVVGTHGLLIRYAGRSGLLLPQVPVEQGWDREAFLDHVCLKAGLAPGTWRKPGVELFGFTAEVFGEDQVAGRSDRA